MMQVSDLVQLWRIASNNLLYLFFSLSISFSTSLTLSTFPFPFFPISHLFFSCLSFLISHLPPFSLLPSTPLASPPLYFPCLSTSLASSPFASPSLLLSFLPSCLLTLSPPPLPSSPSKVEEKPDVTYNDVGGCKEQIEKLKEVVETPLLHVSS